MSIVKVHVDVERPLVSDHGTGHNRWHWDIEPLAHCADGDTLVMATRDALDGQVVPSSCSADVTDLDVARIHPLTGPVWIVGAEPGDLLEVEVLDVRPSGYGFTSQRPGLGLLDGELAEPYLVHWSLQGGAARSQQLPGVTIPGHPFLGIIGVAPSASLIADAISRELAVGSKSTEARSAVPSRGQVPTEGLRTGPPRGNGGNIDVKQLTNGASVFLPVWQTGALLSVGDAHFAQGDGEVCGTAIEMRSTASLTVRLHKAAVDLASSPVPFIVHAASPPPDSSRAFTTLGFPREDEPDRLKGAAAAAVRRLASRIAERYHFPFAAAYALCSVAADLRLCQIVNEPNVAVSASIALSVFDDGGQRMMAGLDKGAGQGRS